MFSYGSVVVECFLVQRYVILAKAAFLFVSNVFQNISVWQTDNLISPFFSLVRHKNTPGRHVVCTMCGASRCQPGVNQSRRARLIISARSSCH